MGTNYQQDQVQFWRPHFIPGAELVSVAYRRRGFPEHSHAEYVVGAVCEGAETLVVDGVSHHVAAGAVLHLNPEQVHANATVGSETLRYKVLYLPTASIVPYQDRGQPLAFAAPVTNDPLIYHVVQRAHALLAENTGQLEQETAVAAIVRTLEQGNLCEERGKTEFSAAILLARDYIDHHFAEAFGLETLSDLTGLSVYHFARSFKKAVGLSPLAYRNQRRIVVARAMLLDGEPITQVAVSVGYADQSHLTRQFQRIVGLPPGRYRQQ